MDQNKVRRIGKEIEVVSDDGDEMIGGFIVKVLFLVEMENVNRYDVEQSIFDNVCESFNVGDGKICKVSYSSSRILNDGKVVASLVVSIVNQNIRKHRKSIMRYIENDPFVLFNTFNDPIHFDRCEKSDMKKKYIIFRDILIV